MSNKYFIRGGFEVRQITFHSVFRLNQSRMKSWRLWEIQFGWIEWLRQAAQAGEEQQSCDWGLAGHASKPLGQSYAQVAAAHV